MLEWKADYETGVPAIDTQHKVLFNHINRLEEVLKKSENERAEADYLLAFLENYAEQHFKGEETCMARFRCPAHAKNKEEHKQFMDFLVFGKSLYQSSGSPKEVLERLHESMVWWINNHILKVDVQLKDRVRLKKTAR